MSPIRSKAGVCNDHCWVIATLTVKQIKKFVEPADWLIDPNFCSASSFQVCFDWDNHLVLGEMMQDSWITWIKFQLPTFNFNKIVNGGTLDWVSNFTSAFGYVQIVSKYYAQWNNDLIFRGMLLLLFCLLFWLCCCMDYAVEMQRVMSGESFAWVLIHW